MDKRCSGERYKNKAIGFLFNVKIDEWFLNFMVLKLYSRLQ